MINDLDFLETISEDSNLVGGVYAGVWGSTYAGYGAGAANTYALALGQTTQTNTNTSTVASLSLYDATTVSTGTASAYANTGTTTARATYYGNSYYSSFGGSSMSMDASMTSSTLQTR